LGLHSDVKLPKRFFPASPGMQNKVALLTLSRSQQLFLKRAGAQTCPNPTADG